MKVVVTGGGTGGHLFPALAVAEALRDLDPNADLVFVGGKGKMESRLVPPTGLAFTGITAGKLTKPISMDGLKTLVALGRGYVEASRFLRSFKPNVLVSTGGYVAAATAIAAARRKVPIMIQAHDTVPGRTNRWLERWTTKVCIWLEESAAYFPADKLVRSGVPLRKHTTESCDKFEARRILGLNPELPTLFVLGGSQGAKRLNELTVDALGLLGSEVQCLHQTGEANYADTVKLAAELNLDTSIHLPRPFLDAKAMPLAYSAADILVCRCGITSLAEGAVHGLPMLMVPLPSAYADHQTHNAEAVARHGAGPVLPQDNLSGPILAGVIRELLGSSVKREQYGNASRTLGRPNAAMDVARLALELAR